MNTTYLTLVPSSVLGASFAAAVSTFAATGMWSIATAAGDVDRPKHTHQGSPPREFDPV